MSGMGEARLVISAIDQSARTFAAVEKNAGKLGKTLEAAGAAAKSLGSVHQALGDYARAGKDLDSVAAAVERAAKATPRLASQAEAVGRAATASAARMRELEGEARRVETATSRIEMFRSLQPGLARARADFASARTAVQEFGRGIEAADARLAKLRGDLAAAKAAGDKAWKSVEAAPRPTRADAADEAVFRAKLAANAAAMAPFNDAVREQHRLRAEIADAVKARGSLDKDFDKARASVSKAAEAFDREKTAVIALKREIEGLAGPVTTLASAEDVLHRQAEAVASAMNDQVGAARRAAQAAESAARQEQAAAAHEAEAEKAAHRRAHDMAHHGIVNYAAGAAAGAVSAHGVMSALEQALDAGAERQSTLVGMKNAGMPEDEVRRAQDLAARVSRDAPNLDVSQILELHKEARSAVQHPEEVFEILPDLARAASVLKGLGADNANIADMVKGAESLGLMGDPKRFHGFLDAQVRAMKVMGKTITTEQIYEAAKYSKSAGATLSDDFLNLTLPSVIQEMHGSSAGDALSALTKRWRGGLAHQHLAVTRLNEMGLLEDPSKIVRAKKSGEIMGYTGKLKGDALLGTDPDRFFREVWEPHAGAIGAKTLSDKIKLLNETLPSTAANLGRIFLQQEETLKQHRENYRNAPNLEQSVDIQRHDPKVAMQTFVASLNDLEAAVTGPTMDAISLGLGRVSGTLRNLADAAKAHPAAAVAAGGAAVAGGLAGSGYLAYQLSRGFGLRSSAEALDGSALALKEAAGAIGTADHRAAPGGGAVKEAEKDAAKSLPFFAGVSVPAAIGAAILAGGAAAGAENAPMVDDLGRVTGSWGGDPDHPFGQNPNAAARPTITFGTMWEWLKSKAGMGGVSVPRPPDNPTSLGHPDDDRLSRARASDADAWQQQQDMMRAASQQFGQLDDRTGVVLTSFDTLGGRSGDLGTALATLAATAEAAAGALAGIAGAAGGNGSGAQGAPRSGIISAAYHPGGGFDGGGSGGALSPLLRGALPHGGGGPAGPFVAPGAEATTAGMRQNNMGNIGWFGQHMAGLIGPSNAHDVDHSIARFATQADGIRAAAALARAKFHGGRHTTWDLVAAKGGWTPGALGPGASVNVARAMGLGNHDAVNLDDEGQLVSFLHGLAVQEHGSAGRFYTADRIRAALHHESAPLPSLSAGPGGGGTMTHTVVVQAEPVEIRHRFDGTEHLVKVTSERAAIKMNARDGRSQGTTGSVGPSRVVADPGVGRSR